MKSSTAGSGAESRETMIEVEGLTRFYGDFPAQQDVSVRAVRGEILGVLGPNGAGKTTAMRIITGYMPPTSGRASVAGHDVVEESLEVRRHIGYLPESTPLYTDMTVREYLDYMARLRDVGDRSQAVQRAMDLTQVDHRADDLIGQLSKGYRQRVGIAQAIVHDPQVIILDEPTIGLDPRQIREVRALVEDLGGDHTIVLSTHILPEAQELCDRVLIINRGHLVAEDTPRELQARLAGGERIRLRVAADLDTSTVTSALAAVEGVQSVGAAGDGLYNVIAATGVNPRPDLAEMVVGRGWPLMEMTPVGMTLEEIFLELTAGDEMELEENGLIAEDMEEEAMPEGDVEELESEENDHE
jgi:ABC-2 type transport system ATP-binding protein